MSDYAYRLNEKLCENDRIHKTVGNFQLDVISDTALLFVAEWSSAFEWIVWVSEILNGIKTVWMNISIAHP